MRVLFVVPSFFPFVGGAQTFVREMAYRLVKAGENVTVLTTNAHQSEDFWRPSGLSPLPWREAHDGFQIVRLPLQYPIPAPYVVGILRRFSHFVGRKKVATPLQMEILRQIAGFLPRLNGLESEIHLLAAETDIIHMVDASWDGLLMKAQTTAIQYQKAFIVTPLIHSGSDGMRATFTMPHQVDAYRSADCVTALSQMEADLLQDMGVAPACCTILPMGVDPQDMNVSSQQIATFRRQYGLTGPIVAFLGAATFDKGAPVLAQAVAKLLQQGEDLWLVFAGPEQQRLSAAVERFPATTRALLAERMRLLGVVAKPTKAVLLAACSALALPSRVDSFGMAALEAANYGKPVIAAAVGGLQETVCHNETGLHVPFGDVDALAHALRTLLHDPAFACRLGTNGRRRTRAQFTWSNTFQELRALYRKTFHAFYP